MELYTSSIENRKDIKYITEVINHNTKDIEECQKSVKEIEITQGVHRGKVAFLAVTLTALCTILVNSALWVIGRIGVK